MGFTMGDSASLYWTSTGSFVIAFSAAAASKEERVCLSLLIKLGVVNIQPYHIPLLCINYPYYKPLVTALRKQVAHACIL